MSAVVFPPTATLAKVGGVDPTPVKFAVMLASSGACQRNVESPAPRESLKPAVSESPSKTTC
jgi:hypothetical protein